MDNINEIIELASRFQPIVNFISTSVVAVLGGGGVKVLFDFWREWKTQKLEKEKFEVKNKDDLIEELSAMIQAERERCEYQLEEERKRFDREVSILNTKIDMLEKQIAFWMQNKVS